MRRRRGIARSSAFAQRAPSQSANGLGEYSSAVITTRATPASRALRNADLERNLFDPAAADDKVTRIEHRRLPGRYGPLRFVEMRLGAVLREGIERRPCRYVPVPDAHTNTRRNAQARPPESGQRQPADI